MKYLKFTLCFFVLFLMNSCEEKYNEGSINVHMDMSSYSVTISAYRIYSSNETFEVGVCYSNIDSTPSLEDSNDIMKKVVSSGSSINQSFYFDDMNLRRGFTYYMRGYIKNKQGIVYSAVQTHKAN